jgi:4-alpha-glucanotransferase
MNEGKAGSSLLKMGLRAGVGLHIASLPGEYGIGDIADSAYSFIDNLCEMGIGVWQFLPTGPTAYGDSPYQPLSAFAGNAMLLGMKPLVRLGLLSASDLDVLRQLPRDHVDYGRLIPVKNALLSRVAEQIGTPLGNGLKAHWTGKRSSSFCSTTSGETSGNTPMREVSACLAICLFTLHWIVPMPGLIRKCC